MKRIQICMGTICVAFMRFRCLIFCHEISAQKSVPYGLRLRPKGKIRCPWRMVRRSTVCAVLKNSIKLFGRLRNQTETNGIATSMNDRQTMDWLAQKCTWIMWLLSIKHNWKWYFCMRFRFSLAYTRCDMLHHYPRTVSSASFPFYFTRASHKVLERFDFCFVWRPWTEHKCILPLHPTYAYTHNVYTVVIFYIASNCNKETWNFLQSEFFFPAFTDFSFSSLFGGDGNRERGGSQKCLSLNCVVSIIHKSSHFARLLCANANHWQSGKR